MTERIYAPGEVVYRAGDAGNSFFRVLEGSARVVVDYGRDSETTLAVLTPGQFFGELSVIGGYSRAATVAACGEGAKLLELTSGDFDTAFAEDPEMVKGLMRYLGGRIRALSKDYEEACAVLEDIKSAGSRPVSESIMDKIRRIAFYYFGKGKGANKPSVEARLLEQTGDLKTGYSASVASYPAGTVLYREGEPGKCMYAIHWGTVGIFSGYGTDSERKLTELSVNQFFGEMGLLCGDPRSATAVILDDSTTVETIDEDDLDTLFEKNPPKVLMILEHISLRLRHLTSDYASVCREISDKI